MIEDLRPRMLYGDLDVTEYPYILLKGGDLGYGENLYEALEWLLADGEAVSSHRTSNRTLSFGVAVEGMSQDALARHAAALEREADKPLNTITFYPGADGEPLVFETFRGQVIPERNEDHEAHLIRLHSLEVQAAPFVRSLHPVKVPALPPAPPVPTVTTLWDGSSAAGWSAASGGIVFDGGGTPSVSTADSGVALFYDTPFVVPAGVWYLKVTTSAHIAGVTTGDSRGGLMTPAVRDGNTTYYRLPSDVTVQRLMLLASRWWTWAYAPIEMTDALPVLSSGRQQWRSLEVEGTARTQGSLHLSHPTDALGSVTVYTNAETGSGYQPPAMRHRASAQVPVVDAAAMNGQHVVATTADPLVLDIPARALDAGAHVVMARCKVESAGARTFSVTASTRLGGNNLGTETDLRHHTGFAGGAYRVVEIATLDLPPADTQADGAVVRITVDPGAADTLFDEVWLFNARTGSLVRFAAGQGTPSVGGSSSHAWIDGPTVDRPRPAIYVGTQADRSDARHLGQDQIVAWEPQIWQPGQMNVFVVTDAPNASVDLEYPARFHSYPYRIEAAS